jgi:transposase
MPKKDRWFNQELLQRRYRAGIHNPTRLAHITGMSARGARKAIRRFHSTGSFMEAPHGGRSRVLSANDEQALIELSAAGFQGSASSWVAELKNKTGRLVSPSTMRRALVRLGFTYRTPPRRPSHFPTEAGLHSVVQRASMR